MILTKKGSKNIRVAALSVMSLGFSFMAHFTFATTLYYDANGTAGGYGTGNNGTTSWDGNDWATASGGTTVSNPWVAGDVGEFLATSATYSITVDADESIDGLDSATTTTAETTKIIQAASTPGDLDLVSGANSFTIADVSSVLVVSAPIIGSGEVVQHGNGTLELYGQNTFSGNMEVTGGQLTYYNNSSSFGTGNIIIGGGTSNAFLTGTTSQVTIPNNWTLTDIYPINLVGGTGTLTNPGTIFSGNFPIPTSSTQIFETSNSATNVDEISGMISGGNVAVEDAGTMIFTGANTYKGTTLVSSTLATSAPPTLVLGASGTIASSSEVILSGGILNPDGINQIMPTTTMALNGTTLTSIIDYGVGAAEIDFANSASVAWTSGDILNLANFTLGTDLLRFGTDDTGLTMTQLDEIEYDGNAATLKTAYLSPSGYVEFPEPASLSMLGIGAIGLLARRRK